MLDLSEINKNAWNLAISAMISDQYLFNWGNVPGDDDDKLLKYLGDAYGINWAGSAEIQKSEDGKTIHISNDKKSAEIMIDVEGEKAILKISGGKTCDLKVNKENGNLNLYYSTNWKAFSNGRIRMMYEATSDDHFEIRIRDIIKDYNPPNGIEEKRCCMAFVDELLNMTQGKDKKYAKQLLQYTMWNIYALDKYLLKRKGVRRKVNSMLLCEGLSDKRIIESILEMEQKN